MLLSYIGSISLVCDPMLMMLLIRHFRWFSDGISQQIVPAAAFPRSLEIWTLLVVAVAAGRSFRTVSQAQIDGLQG